MGVDDLKVLFIVHETAWSDKSSAAKNGTQKLIDEGQYDEIIEIIQSRQDIYERRYLKHNGKIYKHESISPTSFLSDVLFGGQPIFPLNADEITLVGGCVNSTGGGCLNEAFEYLIKYLHTFNKKCTINLPFHCTYQAGMDGSWKERFDMEQVVKDLTWKMLIKSIDFTVSIDSELIISARDKASLIDLKVDTRTS